MILLFVFYFFRQEENGKLDDAVASYSKSLVVKPDHQDAKDALWTLHGKTEKLNFSKMSGAAVAKATELKEKLKAILQSDIAIKSENMTSKVLKAKKVKKEKKERRDSSSDNDSSSSSSSDGSESNTSSSDTDSRKGRKSKKSKKKKSRKSASRRSNSKKSKVVREASLSPFSKRLSLPSAPGGGGAPAASGLAGFAESSYAEWGKQLGITKPTEVEVQGSVTYSLFQQ